MRFHPGEHQEIHHRGHREHREKDRGERRGREMRKRGRENWKGGITKIYKSFYSLLSSSVFFSVLSVSSVVNLSSPPW
jgi:hypothetical protein